MSTGRYSQRRRSPRQSQADERADRLAAFLGRGVKEARRARAWNQVHASERAGFSQGCWSMLETGRAAGLSLRVWVRAGDAVGADLRAYLERASGADAPRDATHLRHQELISRIAAPGGWRPQPEHDLGSAGVADLLLARANELALIEVWSWFADVGAAFRSWNRKVERITARGTSAASGCWAVRATRRNRSLIAAHATLFAARFPGSGVAWLAALTDPTIPVPDQPALLWVSVRGDRVFPARGLSPRP